MITEKTIKTAGRRSLIRLSIGTYKWWTIKTSLVLHNGKPHSYTQHGDYSYKRVLAMFNAIT